MICFHNPEEKNGYLSNWYLSDFKMNRKTFTSMEQYMMYSKAILFKDYEIANDIMNTNDVAYIKSLGRVVEGFKEEIWRENRELIIEEGLYAKFSQNESLKEKLLSTGNDTIAECAVRDKIWGIGLSMKDKRRFDEKEWRGQNLLGKCLMRVRERLRGKDLAS